MIIADTSGLLAFFNKREPAHGAISTYLRQTGGVVVVSPFVVAELDYLVSSRMGVEAELTVLRELGSGAYDLPTLDADDLLQCAAIVETYDDQSIGVADASLVLLADRYRTTSILTLDRRHFGVVRTLSGAEFVLPEV